jgi:hypothetical protein
MVYEEMTKAVKQDRSIVHVHEISDLGLMQLSRQRVCILKSLLKPTPIYLGLKALLLLLLYFSTTILILDLSWNIHFSPSYPQSKFLLILRESVCVCEREALI